MSKIFKHLKETGMPQQAVITAAGEMLHHLAFDNSLQPNIITTVSDGKIIVANRAAYTLLGYSKKEILTKSRSTIFDIEETGFKKMLKQRTAEGRSTALVTIIRKNGRAIPCEITSAVFLDEDGIEKAITTIVDMRQHILKQKNIDNEKEKIVAGNIMLAKSKQKGIDHRKEKIVADNIEAARSKQKKIDIHNEKIVADNIVLAKTKQKKIDIHNEKIVADNIVLAETKQKKIDIHNEKVVADNIVLAKTKQKKIDIHNEKIVADNIVLAETKQKKIDIRKEKIVADNITEATAKSAAVQAEYRKWKNYMGKASYDVMWDWDIVTGKIYVGDSLEEVFGYKIRDNNVEFKEVARCLLPGERDKIEKKMRKRLFSANKTWHDSFMLIRRDGSIALTKSRASIVRNVKGEPIHMIGAIKDVTLLKELEMKVSLQREQDKRLDNEIAASFKLIFNSSTDVLYDSDMVTNEVLISDAYENVYGYKITGNMTPMLDWISYIHPDDKEAVLQDYVRVVASAEMEWKKNYRFLKADGSVANVISRCIIIRNAEGTALRMIGSMQDNSKEKVLEEKLEQEIKLKEKQIAEASSDAKDTERSDIGKELHDNINQLLGASRLYLEMAKQGGVNSKMYLSRSSEYTLSAIDEIRKLTKGLTTDTIKNLGLCEAIENIVRDTMEINPLTITANLEKFIEYSVHEKFKLNLFRIVQEQLNNILKHAQATKVNIVLSQNKKFVVLSISDNGVGFDIEKKRTGIGVDNIKSRAGSFNGSAAFVSQPGQGCLLTVTFPLAGPVLNRV
jgi:PAS domain S-box-containing protein